jgi:hypothetical protein
MPNTNAPFHPIIYVRGYAMTIKEIDETTADPFCGFNIGSTVYRATPDKKSPPRKFIFESPLVRLGSEFRYRDIYEEGHDLWDEEWSPDKYPLACRSVIIFRYYDEASQLLGIGRTPPITDFAVKLGKLIMRVRELVCANPANNVSPADFRCHLVAHSMGGLVCRALLQNPDCDPDNASKYVDKFFTYASPHNGIEMGGLNAPSWLSANDVDNFNRKRMADYLNLQDIFEKTDRVDWLPEDRFPTARAFCMVATNRSDYEVAFGASRTFVGHGSDGLVRIENATLRGITTNGEPGRYCARAYAYRSHSGYFGIVNSEESYQNLIRFLFGDIRADVWIDFEEIRLPVKVQDAEDQGRSVNALYQIELAASPKGKPWYLTRRTSEEDSVACLTHAEWKSNPSSRSVYVSSIFLANSARVDPEKPGLSYSLSLGIRVPDYEIERKLWMDQHYEGGYLYRDVLIIELNPPNADEASWTIKCASQKDGVKLATKKLNVKELGEGEVEVSIPFKNTSTPGVSGQIRFVISQWNEPDRDS